MLYMGYLIILDGQNIKKNLFQRETSVAGQDSTGVCYLSALSVASHMLASQ